MKKKNIAITSVSVAAIILISVGLALLLRRSKNVNYDGIEVILETKHSKEYWDEHIEEWIEHYKNNTGYEIKVNRDYKAGEKGYPEEIIKIESEVDSISFFASNIGKKDAKEFFFELDEEVIDISSGELGFLDDYIEEDSLPRVFGMFVGEDGGDIFFSYVNQDSIIGGVLFDSGPTFVSESENGQAIQNFINDYRGILGKPQVEYYDDLYEDTVVDYYFDKGVAFTDSKIIIFEPSENIDKDLVEQVGIGYIRSVQGNTYLVLGLSE